LQDQLQRRVGAHLEGGLRGARTDGGAGPRVGPAEGEEHDQGGVRGDHRGPAGGRAEVISRASSPSA
ncbi:MAG: hypothetical protein ACK559_42105, partial [bacterium]